MEISPFQSFKKIVNFVVKMTKNQIAIEREKKFAIDESFLFAFVALRWIHEDHYPYSLLCKNQVSRK